jgi:hypothetical protein
MYGRKLLELVMGQSQGAFLWRRYTVFLFKDIAHKSGLHQYLQP